MDVSVIIPAYNSESTIAESLDSILRQRFSGSFEILIADDCSTDKTKEIILYYESRYPGIVKPYFREKNLGCSQNCFLLTALAKGEYLAFCDSDDIWTNSYKLQIQFDFLRNHPDFGLCCSQSLNCVEYTDNQDVVYGGVRWIFLI